MRGKRLKQWRSAWVLSLSLFVSGCEQPSRTDLTITQVQETIEQFNQAFETMNSALLAPLLSPTVVATFYQAGSGRFIRYEGPAYFALLRDVLEHANSYIRKHDATKLRLHSSKRSAQVATRIHEQIDIAGHIHSTDEHETLIIELIDGKALITSIGRESVK